ncbi:hypothetical protein JST56_02245 [Candidatus Dependentiae bacterium]|nr:hypothetical protein [Candidatus Dependentiae bacterium]
MQKEQSFSLEIISSTAHKTFLVTGLEIESPTGSCFIGYGHMPLISVIKKKSTVTYQLSDGTSIQLQVNGGIFNISQNKAVILLDA